MLVKCMDCQDEYDDKYRTTICPHNTFNMHCLIFAGGVQYVAVSLADLQAIRNHPDDNPDLYRYAAIRDVPHKHTKAGACLTPDRSGYLTKDA